MSLLHLGAPRPAWRLSNLVGHAGLTVFCLCIPAAALLPAPQVSLVAISAFLLVMLGLMLDPAAARFNRRCAVVLSLPFVALLGFVAARSLG